MRFSPVIIGSLAALAFAAESAHAQWSLNGVKVFYNAGNVGIGTNNPAHKLEVRSAGTRTIFGYSTPAAGQLFAIYGQADSTEGRAVYALANSATGTNYAVVGKTNSASGYAAWFVGGKNYFEGRVGIGGTNPSQKLQVNGNVKVTGWIGTDTTGGVDLRSKSKRVFFAQHAEDAFGDGPNVIGGLALNSVGEGVLGATIAGGGFTLAGLNFPNAVNNDYGTVGGGGENVVGGSAAVIAGGLSNTAAGNYAVVGGGSDNDAPGEYALISGGSNNLADGQYATITGGQFNTASGVFATVAGGSSNSAGGNTSFAGGRRAKVRTGVQAGDADGDQGTFIWADNTNSDITSTGPNQFLVRASGGIWLGTNSAPDIPETDFINTSTGAHLTTGGTWTNASSKDLKENFSAISPREILQKVINMSITKWNYKAEGKNISHLGPVSQDFAQAFGLGVDDKSIATVDADGVALAAIQGLHQIVKEKDQQIEQLQQRIEKLEAIAAKLTAAKAE